MSYNENKHFHRPDGRRRGLSLRSRADAGKSRSEAVLFGELLDSWLAVTRLSVKESSFVQYRKLVDNYVRPYLAKLPICELDRAVLDKHVIFLSAEGRKDRRGGLSPKSVYDVMSVVRDCLRYAAALGLPLSFDPGPVTVRKNAPDMRVLSPEEQKKLMRVLSSGTDNCKLGVMLSLYTGLRIGELCALKWENFDLDNKLLSVRKTLQRIQSDADSGPKTRIVITSPKSEHSVRTIPLPPFLAELSAEFYTAPEDFVLSGSPERFVEPRTMQYRFKKYVAEAGIADANFHALRHTFATRCIECGFETKSLSEILGHSSVSLTLNRYAHASMELKRQNMNKLNSVCVV